MLVKSQNPFISPLCFNVMQVTANLRLLILVGFTTHTLKLRQKLIPPISNWRQSHSERSCKMLWLECSVAQRLRNFKNRPLGISQVEEKVDHCHHQNLVYTEKIMCLSRLRVEIRSLLPNNRDLSDQRSWRGFVSAFFGTPFSPSSSGDSASNWYVNSSFERTIN